MEIRFGTVRRVYPGCIVDSPAAEGLISIEKPNVSISLQKGKKEEIFHFKVDNHGDYRDLDNIFSFGSASARLDEALFPIRFNAFEDMLKLTSMGKKKLACYLAARAKDLELLDRFLKSKESAFTNYSMARRKQRHLRRICPKLRLMVQRV